MEWLRRRPLAHFSKSMNTLMVHAGLHPKWTIRKALARAAEVEAVLQGIDYRDFLPKLYGNTPSRWSGRLTGNKRQRFIVNCLTRIRMIDGSGRLDYSHKGPPDRAGKGLIPWFEAPDARWRGTRIVFGHWSALGLIVKPDLIGIDTGCVWNRELTAVRLDKRRQIAQVGCSE
jgi:bis(5'-nucleosyl)-tetraphosphatase (symmetrical)